MPLDVFLPQDRQRDVLALELPVNHRPVGFGMPAMALLGAGVPIESRFQLAVGNLLR